MVGKITRIIGVLTVDKLKRLRIMHSNERRDKEQTESELCP